MIRYWVLIHVYLLVIKFCWIWMGFSPWRFRWPNKTQFEIFTTPNFKCQKNPPKCAKKIIKILSIYLNTWPTLEQGAISIVPPHIQALKLSSKFSPPQTSMPSSKNPSSSKKSFRMAKSPPANIGFSWGAQIFGFLARSLASNSCLEKKKSLKWNK